jgi:hypothetical protein
VDVSVEGRSGCVSRVLPLPIPTQGQGSCDRSLAAGILGGHPVLKILEDGSYAGAHLRGSLQRPATLYVTQDAATGAIAEVGDSASHLTTLLQLLTRTAPAVRIPTTPADIVPGAWSAGGQSSYYLAFPDGDAEKSQMWIDAAETVTTPMGPIPAWKVERSTNYIFVQADPIASPAPGGSPATTQYTLTSHATEWWAPQLGCTVREIIDTEGDGLSYKAEYVLASTSATPSPGD